jgi:hypothetical protein
MVLELQVKDQAAPLSGPLVGQHIVAESCVVVTAQILAESCAVVTVQILSQEIR